MSTAAKQTAAPILTLFRGDDRPSDRPHAGLTLSQLYWRHFRRWLQAKRRSPRTFEAYEETLALWALCTGDPPLELISDATCVSFTEWLAGRTWRGTVLTAQTIAKHCDAIQRLLDSCLPKRREAKDRARYGILDDVPYLVRPDLDEPDADKDFSIEEIESLLEAALRAKRRRGLVVPAPVFWRSLIFFALNTGFRAGTLLGLEFSMLSGDRLFPDASIVKKRKKLGWPLNSFALEVIERIRAAGATKRIFPWPNWPASKGNFYEHWREIREAAGVRPYGLHAIRRLHITELAAINPFAAQKSAGHSAAKVTCERYTSEKVLRDALPRIRQPKQPTRQLELF